MGGVPMRLLVRVKPIGCTTPSSFAHAPMEKLLDPSKKATEIIKIKCTHCGFEGSPKTWVVRSIICVLLFLGIWPGLIFSTVTNPYICSNCNRREFLVKTLNDGSNITITSLSKVKFLVIFFILFGVVVAAAASKNIEEAVLKKNDNGLQLIEKSSNYGEAAKIFDQAARESNDNENKIEILKNAAYSYVTNDDLSSALTKFKEALGLTQTGTYDYYLISGEIALIEEKPRVALYNFNQALSIHPNEYQVNNSLAIFYAGLDDETSSFVDYQKAVEYGEVANRLNPSETAKTNLGIIYVLSENFDKAISLLLKTNLNVSASKNYWLGLAYLGKKDFVNAKKYLQKSADMGMELDPQIESFLNSNMKL